MEAILTPYYLRDQGRLSPESPEAGMAPLSYDFDPKKPVPSIGGLVVAPPPEYAYSHDEKRKLLLFISWSHQDYLDEKDEDPEDRK